MIWGGKKDLLRFQKCSSQAVASLDMSQLPKLCGDFMGFEDFYYEDLKKHEKWCYRTM